MTQLICIHPINPQSRFINQVVDIIKNGGLIAYPTDSSYAFGCYMGDKAAMERIYRLRQLDNSHNFTLVCRDLSEIATYAKVENHHFRLMRSLTPGAYTFILKATHEVPRRLQNPKRKTIGIRVPDHNIAHALLEALDEPLMSSTLILPREKHPETDPEEIFNKIGKHLDAVIDGGNCGFEPTTVIDLTEECPKLIRQGKGTIEMLGIEFNV
jgi:tRNA threonylcarbamoyl adenosine modification protein (Sua5/YciO/YrdC/YwlC family)